MFVINKIIGHKERAKTVERKKQSAESNINKKIKKSEKIPKKQNKVEKISKNKKNKKTSEINEDDKSFSSDNENNNTDLYSLLGVNRTATNEEIRLAYRRLVFLYHPDKNKIDPNATSKFISISHAYKILSNRQSRTIYDETGEYDEEENEQKNRKISINDFRKRFNVNDIDNYEKKYRGSQEEIEDLIIYYNKYQGDISHILDSIPFSRNTDVKRFLKIYEKLFKIKRLKRTNKYEKVKNNIILLKNNVEEEKEAKEMLEKLSRQVIEKRNNRRNYHDYLLDLARRYDSDKIDEIKDEINEEEFNYITKNLNNKRKKEKIKNRIKK